MRTLKTLDLEDARTALRAMQAELSRLGVNAVVCVADAHGDLLALERTDGASPSSITIAMNKAWTAARERVRTLSIGERIRGGGEETFDIAYYGDPRYLGWGGGVPVELDGACVGAVAVSGLPEREDERIAKLGVAAIEARIRG